MPESNSAFSLERIEEEKRRRNFDEALAAVIERVAVRQGQPFSRDAILETVKRRINAEIVLPALERRGE